MSSLPATNGVDFIAVSDEYAGQRVDNFLLARLKRVPRSRVYRLIRKGEVRVNKKRVRPVYRLQAGDVVRVPPVHRPRVERGSVAPGSAQMLRSRILLEDERLLILDKPAGIAVHGGSGIDSGIIERVRALGGPYGAAELVHRLDRETSGCLILAKRRSSLRQLHRMFREGGVAKRYLTLVQGIWPAARTRVDVPLLRREIGGERMVITDPRGSPAVTEFEVLQSLHVGTLLAVSPVTGRTHQIRVHARSVGCPVAGDEKYGDADFNRQMRTQGLRRLFLHASALEFPHPFTGAPIRVEAPLPGELNRFVNAIAASAAGRR